MSKVVQLGVEFRPPPRAESVQPHAKTATVHAIPGRRAAAAGAVADVFARPSLDAEELGRGATWLRTLTFQSAALFLGSVVGAGVCACLGLWPEAGIATAVAAREGYIAWNSNFAEKDVRENIDRLQRREAAEARADALFRN